jgi:hypothetical protein
MKTYPHKVFERDRILRDENWKPVGRIILGKPYVEGEPLAVTLLKVPKVLYSGVRGHIFYVDGRAYRVPQKLDPVKVGGNGTDHLLNNFYMELVEV